MDEDTEYLQQPLEDRCVHKLWKARISAYEELTKLFNQWEADDPNWKKYVGQAKKFIADSNAVAQEKGLEAALALVENCGTASKVVVEYSDNVINKCLAAPKARTKDLGKQILLMFCEIEQPDKVVEELIKGLNQKNPKVTSGCVNTMTECLRAFGAKVIKVSPLLKAVLPLLDHRDKGVREEGKQLIVEAYRWVGDIMKQQLSGLKPVQLSELEAEFENLKNSSKAKPERYLRSQQLQFATAGDAEEPDAGGKGAQDDGAEEEADVDAFDLIDPVDILDKLPKNFYELVEEKKWQTRKEALDALLPLSQSPKLASGDYSDLLRVLKKFIGKDTNVMLVALAAQCLAGLAKGLRNQMKQGASQCLPVVLEKFKEKKTNVVNALVEAADALFLCLGIDNVQEDCLAALKHKTPSVNSETAKFLGRCFAKCPAPLFTNKKMVKGYVSALAEALNHSDVTVRDAAAEALGVLFKLFGETSMGKLLPDIDNIKLGKIKEFSDKADITGKRPKIVPQSDAADPSSKQTSTGKAAKPGSKAVRPSTAKPKVSTSKPAALTESADEEPVESMRLPSAPKSAPPARSGSASAPSGAAGVGQRKTSSARPRVGVMSRGNAAASSGRKKGEEIDSSPVYMVSNLKNVRFKDEAKLKILKWNFAAPRAEFVDQLKEQMETANFNKTLMAQMFHADFKQHIKAVETLMAAIDADTEALISNLDLLLKWTTLRFFETNPSVLIRVLEYLGDVFSALADESYNLHDIEAISFIPYLISKVGDPKDQVRNSVRSILKKLRHVYPVSKLSPFLMEGLKAKNAKQRAECLDDLGIIIRDYSLQALQPSPAACLKEMAKSISDRDNSVRNAALNSIAEAFFQTGDKIYKMIGNLPDKDLSMLEERIKRMSANRGPVQASAAVPVPAPSAPLPPSNTPGSVAEAKGALAGRNRAAIPALSSAGLRRQTGSSPLQPRSPQGNPGAGRGGQSRPTSGVLAMNLDCSEDGEERSPPGPQLVSHRYLEEILSDGPMPTGQSQTNCSASVDLARTQTASLGSPVRNVTDLSESYEALDVVLSQVLSKDTSTCVSALAQLDELIKDDGKVSLLADRMDQLLMACYMQYRHVLSSKLRMEHANLREVTRVFQYVTMVLMSIYHHQSLTVNASTSALHDLLHVIISIILEPLLFQMDEGKQLIRALNVLTVKMIERSHHTAISCALLKLLKDNVANKALSPKFIELVMKCLWKVIRILPKWLADEQGVQLDLLLSDVHDFLQSYPSKYWKTQESDMPVRTIKTILHTLVKTKGDVILTYTYRITDPDSSDMIAYIYKLINMGVGKENNENCLTIKNGASNSIGPAILPKQSKNSDVNDDADLEAIFSRIGQKEQSQQALIDLYNFKKKCPNADQQLEPFLEKSSQYFRRYIERGLNSIDQEANLKGSASDAHANILSDVNTRKNENATLAVAPTTTNTNNNTTAVADGYTPQHYMERLKMLRAKAGLSNLDSPGSSVSSLSTIDSNIPESHGSSSSTHKDG